MATQRAATPSPLSATHGASPHPAASRPTTARCTAPIRDGSSIAEIPSDPFTAAAFRAGANASGYETGQLLPPLSYAGHLDGLYAANGWVKLSLSALYAATWDPWGEGHAPASTEHAHEWPAAYRGPVWVVVNPLLEHAGRPHALTLDWGAWSAALTVTIKAEGRVLATGKSVDRSGVAVTFNQSDLPVFALGGAGEAPAEYPVTRIQRKWRYSDVRLPLWQRFK